MDKGDKILKQLADFLKKESKNPKLLTTDFIVVTGLNNEIVVIAGARNYDFEDFFIVSRNEKIEMEYRKHGKVLNVTARASSLHEAVRDIMDIMQIRPHRN